MRIEHRQLLEQPPAGGPVFTEADDAAAAHRDAGLSDARDGLKTIVIRAGGDNPAVELWRGVEIVIVRGQSSVCERVRLVLGEHSQRAARLQAERAHAAHHLEHVVEGRPVLDLAPRRPHAEARRSLRPRAPRRLQHLVDGQRALGTDRGAVMGRLRAVGAVFRASAGLHVEQDASLYYVRAVMGAMDELRPKDQVEQRRRVDFFNFSDRPIVARLSGIGCDHRAHNVTR